MWLIQMRACSICVACDALNAIWEVGKKKHGYQRILGAKGAKRAEHNGDPPLMFNFEWGEVAAGSNKERIFRSVRFRTANP